MFSCLVTLFDFTIRNLPEASLEGRVTTKGRVEYCFRAFRSVVFLLVKFKFKLVGPKDRLDAIAQVIAECDGQATSWHKISLADYLLMPSR